MRPGLALFLAACLMVALTAIEHCEDDTLHCNADGPL